MDTIATPLAGTLDLFDDAMALCEAETGLIRQANAAFRAWTGKPEARLLAEVLPDVLEDKTRTTLEQKGRATVLAECVGDRGRHFQAEFTLKLADGPEGTPLLAVHGRSLARIKEKEAMLASFTQMIDTNNRMLRRQKKALADLLDNMRQAVFSVRRDGRVESEFSAYTHTLFGAGVAIANQPVIDLLQLRETCDDATVQSMTFWLANIFGADELQWMLAEDLGLREVTYWRPTPDGEPERRQLELDYAPIYEDDLVDRIMIIARDVTDLKALEATVETQGAEYRQNLDRVSEIAGLDPELFETFLAESRELIGRCGPALAQLHDAAHGPAAVDEIFRHMHTLKGNARIFKITSIQDEAHEAETLLQRLQQGEARLDADTAARLQASVASLSRSLASFEMLGQQILFGIARTADGGDATAQAAGRRRSGPVVKVPEARILDLRQAFKDLKRRLPDVPDLAPVDEAVQRLTMVPIAELTERLAKMVYDLGHELGKPVADLVVSGDELHVDARLLDKMRDVLMHALRNAVDHGLETAEARAAAGKSAKGTVRVVCTQEGGDLIVAVGDDGRGVDLERVKAVAFAKSLLSEPELDLASEDELLQLLFRPGFSTAAKVTDVSGRGVGMDVIQATAADLQGHAGIQSVAGRGTTVTLTIPAGYFQQL